MIRFVMILLNMLVLASALNAHELTPTYFQFQPSIYPNVYRTEMLLFNRREDVRYYEITVYDDKWNAIPFATKSNILNVEYLKKIDFTVYIRYANMDKVTYICTESKLLKDDVTSTGVSSRICSKIK